MQSVEKACEGARTVRFSEVTPRITVNGSDRLRRGHSMVQITVHHF